MKAFVVEKIADREFSSGIQEVSEPKCGENEIIIKVTYSSLNYKDALSSVGNPGVTRKFPHTTGIDVAGTVYQSQ
jgi:NADPH:quinone reductase-like Zn-dependent oxidoreductase